MPQLAEAYAALERLEDLVEKRGSKEELRNAVRHAMSLYDKLDPNQRNGEMSCKHYHRTVLDKLVEVSKLL